MAAILQSSRTEEVLAELGTRVRRLRLDRNLTVEELARRCGTSVRTINRMEAGTGVGIEHWIRVLRGLDRLQAVDAFLPQPTVSPIQLSKMGGRVRERATGKRHG